MLMKKIYAFMLVLVVAMFGQGAMAQSGYDAVIPETGNTYTIRGEVNEYISLYFTLTRDNELEMVNADEKEETDYYHWTLTEENYLQNEGNPEYYLCLVPDGNNFRFNVSTEPYEIAWGHWVNIEGASAISVEAGTEKLMGIYSTGETIGYFTARNGGAPYYNFYFATYDVYMSTNFVFHNVSESNEKTYTCHVIGCEDGRVCYDGWEYEDGETFEADLNRNLLSALPVEGFKTKVEVDSCDITATYTELGEYPVNFDEDQTYIRSDRYIMQIRLTPEDQPMQSLEVPYTSYTESRMYQFLTADDSTKTFVVNPGATVTPAFYWRGLGMNGVVYLDVDNDGSFEGDAVTPEGESAIDVDEEFPSFIVPTEPGRYRMRYLVDAECLNPGGQEGTTESIVTNGGSITDVILEVVDQWEVTYNFKYNGELVATETFLVKPGSEYPTPTAAPAYSDYTLPEGTVQANGTFDIEVTFDRFPFQLSTDYDSAKWYYIKMRNSNYAYFDAENIETGATPCSTTNSKTDEFKWAFVGDPCYGFTVINKAAGGDLALTYDPNTDTYNTFTADGTIYVLDEVPGKVYDDDRDIYIKVKDEDNYYFNYRSGMYYWNNAAARGETGSALAIMEVLTAREDLHDLIEVAEANNYGENAGKIGYLTTEAAEAFLGAIEAAKEVYDDETLTEEDYHDAYAALQEMIEGFGADALCWPESGMTVVFRNRNYDLSTNFTLYMDEEGLQISNDEDMGAAQQFKLEAIDEDAGTFTVVNVATEKYMVWKSGNGQGYNSNTGMLDEYESPYCDWTFYSTYSVQKGTFLLASTRGNGNAGTLIIKQADGTFDAYSIAASGTRTDYCNQFYIEEVGGEDAIAEVAGSKERVAGGIYNLAGQVVGKDYKGIVIVGGRKTLVK